MELELELLERCGDRVMVSLWLGPIVDQPTAVQGASVRLVDVAGEELCPRTLLPIAGRVEGPIAMSVELRGTGPLPDGARVVASVWSSDDAWDASCPADPYVRLRDHMTGARIGLPDPADLLLECMSDAARLRVEAQWPWVAEPIRVPAVTAVIEAESEEPSAEDIVDDLGLDDEAASWLKDLLDEDD